MAEVETRKRGIRIERKGVVISISGSKSLVVMVELRRRHPQYSKEVRQFKKYHVHDEKSEAKVGDKVRIVETRPVSKMKRWRLVGIL